MALKNFTVLHLSGKPSVSIHNHSHVSRDVACFKNFAAQGTEPATILPFFTHGQDETTEKCEFKKSQSFAYLEHKLGWAWLLSFISIQKRQAPKCSPFIKGKKYTLAY